MRAAHIVIGGLVLGTIGFVAGWVLRGQADGFAWAEPSAFDAGVGPSNQGRFNGFEIENLTVARRHVQSGGPPKDGIPSIVDPVMAPLASVDFLEDDDRVVGLEFGGQARAYPLRLLSYHEAVNDVVGDVPVLIVYCPLCDSVSVADRRFGGRALEFGISGLLLNSNVLLFDRSDHALWSQVGLTAVSGPHAGRALRSLNEWELTTFADWRSRHADGLVMSDETGHDRDYGYDVYASYHEADTIMFPVMCEDHRLGRRDRVIGVRSQGTFHAYWLPEIGDRIEDEIVGERVSLERVGPDGRLVMNTPAGAEVVHTYWFAWAAFHPDTDLVGPDGPITAAPLRPTTRPTTQRNEPSG